MSQIKLLTIDGKGLTTNLDRAGYRTSGVQLKIVGSQAEALLYLEQGHKVDVLVINCDHPEIDAASVIRSIKAHASLPKIPIVVTSVQSAARIRSAMEKAGADLFVEQPLPRDMFVEKIKSLLAQQTRTTKRVTALGAIEVVWNGGQISCQIGDLSNSGVLVQATVPVPVGTNVQLMLPVPGYKKALRLKGEVVRFIEKIDNLEDSGTGIRFLNLEDSERKKLESHIDQAQIKDQKMIYYL